MDKKQTKLFELLCEFDDICKENEIEYFVTAGGVLGAIRGGGFLPWDDDIDILIKRDQYEKLDRVLTEKLPPDRAWINEDNTPEYRNSVARYIDLTTTMVYRFLIPLSVPKGLHLDVFVMDPFPSEPEKQLEFRQMVWLYTELRQPYFVSAHLKAPADVVNRKVWDRYRAMADEQGLDAVIDQIRSVITGYDAKDCHLWCVRWATIAYVYEDDWVSSAVQVPFEGRMFPVVRGLYHQMRENFDSKWNIIPESSSRHTHKSTESMSVSCMDIDKEMAEIAEKHDYAANLEKLTSCNREVILSELDRQEIVAHRKYEILCEEAKLLEGEYREIWGPCIDAFSSSPCAQNEDKEGAGNKEGKGDKEGIGDREGTDESAAPSFLPGSIEAKVLEPYLRIQLDASYIKYKLAVPVGSDLLKALLLTAIHSDRYDQACELLELYPQWEEYEKFSEILHDLGELKLNKYYAEKGVSEVLLEKLSDVRELRGQIEIERASMRLVARTGTIQPEKLVHGDDPEILKYFGDIYMNAGDTGRAVQCYKAARDNSRDGILRYEMANQGLLDPKLVNVVDDECGQTSFPAAGNGAGSGAGPDDGSGTGSNTDPHQGKASEHSAIDLLADIHWKDIPEIREIDEHIAALKEERRPYYTEVQATIREIRALIKAADPQAQPKTKKKSSSVRKLLRKVFK